MSGRREVGSETGLGLLYTWWLGDPLPALPPLAAFAPEPTDDPEVMAQLGSCSLDEAIVRMHSHNQAYLARLDGQVVAYGWSAGAHASIGELGVAFAVPPGNRYLWDFATLAAWRGRGVYPRLLQAILAREASEAERFWIGHEMENVASGRGILKAGFAPAGRVERGTEGELALVPLGAPERGAALANLLNIRLLSNTT